jgi:CDP-diacylglycerol--glycerol-3-phosphate 3-phosphatidyltransferase
VASIYDLKPAFQRLLRPAVSSLAERGVRANQVTVAAVVLSAAAGGALALWPGSRYAMLAIAAVLPVRMALNAIDGMLAREYGQQTVLGGVLNELGDVVSDAALYLPFARLPQLPAWEVVAVVLLAVISETAGLAGAVVSGVRRYDGPMGKSDRALVFGLLALGFAIPLWPNWLPPTVMGGVAVLLVLTIYNRTRGAVHGVGQ